MRERESRIISWFLINGLHTVLQSRQEFPLLPLIHPIDDILEIHDSVAFGFGWYESDQFGG